MFYAPDIAQSPVLPEEESAHAVQVLRAEIGTPVLVTDGRGKIYHCHVTNPHRKHCELTIDSVETPSPLHHGRVHIAIAPTKNMDRLEWMIEKCTEMGIDELTLLLCDHSERKVVNMDRLNKIMVAAAKQSLRATFPILNPLVRFSDFVQHAVGTRFIAHCEDGYAASGNKFALQSLVQKGEESLVLIGPEGDFSPREIAEALQYQYRPVSLGNGRLRTETAGLVACHTIIMLNEL